MTPEPNPGLDGFIAEAARMAEPVFLAQGWTYGQSREGQGSPDRAELALMLRYLVDQGHQSRGGRFMIEESDGDLVVFLELGRLDLEATQPDSAHAVWPAGTMEKARELDHLGVPVDANRLQATEMLRSAGINTGRVAVLAAALRYRREHDGSA
jgi:hypothetical protein